jgi:hypothetical protein
MSGECGRRALIEKLVDGELDDVAQKEMEAHLATCEFCRSHHAFLAAVAESARDPALPEPPPSYWEHLPRKILARLDSEEMASPGGGFWQRLLEPDALKWEALVATLLVVVAVGATALRRNLLAPPSERPSSAAPAETERRVAPAEAVPPPEAPVEPEAPPSEPKAPSMARDEAFREDEAVEGSALATETEEAVQSLGYAAGEPPGPVASAPAAMPAPSIAREQAEAEPGRAKTNLQRPTAALRARAYSAQEDLGITDCDLLRDRIAGDPESSASVWYELARCSVRRYGEDPRPELRDLAIEDAEAFLRRESEGARAEEVRRALERLQPRPQE